MDRAKITRLEFSLIYHLQSGTINVFIPGKTVDNMYQNASDESIENQELIRRTFLAVAQ